MGGRPSLYVVVIVSVCVIPAMCRPPVRRRRAFKRSSRFWCISLCLRLRPPPPSPSFPPPSSPPPSPPCDRLSKRCPSSLSKGAQPLHAPSVALARNVLTTSTATPTPEVLGTAGARTPTRAVPAGIVMGVAVPTPTPARTGVEEATQYAVGFIIVRSLCEWVFWDLVNRCRPV